MKPIIRALAPITVSLLLAGCAGNIESQDVDKHIDTASAGLKNEIHNLQIDRQLNELNTSVKQMGSDVVNNPDLKNIGNQMREGLDQMSHMLDRWLGPEHSPADKV